MRQNLSLTKKKLHKQISETETLHTDLRLRPRTHYCSHKVRKCRPLKVRTETAVDEGSWCLACISLGRASEKPSSPIEQLFLLHVRAKHPPVWCLMWTHFFFFSWEKLFYIFLSHKFLQVRNERNPFPVINDHMKYLQ